MYRIFSNPLSVLINGSNQHIAAFDILLVVTPPIDSKRSKAASEHLRSISKFGSNIE